MNNIVKVIVMMMILIGIYLFLSKGSDTVSIIKTVGENTVKGVKALQGRSV